MASSHSKRQRLAASSEEAPDSSSGKTLSSSSANGSELVGSASANNNNKLADGVDPAGKSAEASGETKIEKPKDESESEVADDDDDDEGDDDDEDDDDDDDDDDEDDDDDGDNNNNTSRAGLADGNHSDIQDQLAAAGPAGVAAAAAIASARKRKRPHSFETNPSVRKRQQTRLIRKLRACIDEYTMRVGQQAVVLITMPGKTAHNFKVFGAQPLESVIRACKQEIMGELEQALAEQAPLQFKEDANKHELPPLVIDGIPTPVEKMTQAQLRAFIPLMLKYSTGRGKPGWGKESTRPAWWPESLPWANVRSDARDEGEKQRISWTTTLRQIVTNCYKYHNRDDLLPSFDENEESLGNEREQNSNSTRRNIEQIGSSVTKLGSASTRSSRSSANKEAQLAANNQSLYTTNATAYTHSSGSSHHQFVHTIANGDGTVSLIQVDPANAQILTLPDGTQVRAVRLQTLGSDSICGQQITELQEATQLELMQAQEVTGEQQQTLTLSEASLGADGQIIITGEDGTQSCYPMSSLVSIPASVYQQIAQGGQQLSVVTADGQSIQANAISMHQIQEDQQHQQQLANEQQQVQLVERHQADKQPKSEQADSSNDLHSEGQVNGD